jgi:hypothetical protein
MLVLCSACTISLNQPATCGNCRSQNKVALKVPKKKMSKEAAPLSSIFRKKTSRYGTKRKKGI